MTTLEKLDLCSELLKDWADKVHQIRGMTTWTDQHLRLMFGELLAQELRAVRAVKGML